MDTPAWARGVLRWVSHEPAIDAPAVQAQRLADRVIGDGSLARLLQGTWLGHPLHPALTDLPIGFWTSAMVLDVFGGRRGAPTARRFVAWGLVCALPTVAAGAADWREMDAEARRIGAVHGALNAGAIVLYAWSWKARRHHHVRGIALGFAGATAATAAAYFGGELVFPTTEPVVPAPA